MNQLSPGHCRVIDDRGRDDDDEQPVGGPAMGRASFDPFRRIYREAKKVIWASDDPTSGFSMAAQPALKATS